MLTHRIYEDHRTPAVSRGLYACRGTLRETRALIKHSRSRMSGKSLQRAVTAVAAVLLFYSRTAEPAAEPNTTHGVEPVTHGEEPLVLAMQRPCRAEQNDYCLHGTCFYASDLNQSSCLCDKNFEGQRCEQYILYTWEKPQYEEIIGITCGVLLLLGCIAIISYICYRKRCWKSSPPYKNYGHENSV